MLWSHFYGRGKKFPSYESSAFSHAAEDRSVTYDPIHPRGDPSTLGLLATCINFISLLRDLPIAGTQHGPSLMSGAKCPSTGSAPLLPPPEQGRVSWHSQTPGPAWSRRGREPCTGLRGTPYDPMTAELSEETTMVKPASDEHSPESPLGLGLCHTESSTSALSKKNYNHTLPSKEAAVQGHTAK